MFTVPYAQNVNQTEITIIIVREKGRKGHYKYSPITISILSKINFILQVSDDN